jgi:hypothetical protein
MEGRQRRSFTDDYKRQAADLVASSGRSIGSVANAGAQLFGLCLPRCRSCNAPDGLTAGHPLTLAFECP